MKRALILGITGQDGSYLAELLLSLGYEVHGIIRRASSFNTFRIDHIFDRLHLHFGDLADGSGLSRIIAAIHPDEIYNLAAQSHVAVSFETPEYTTDINATGTVRLLEAMRAHAPEARYYQASSSEMFGRVAETPQTETTPFHPRSPYGCAKVFSYFQTLNYRESYGLHASNGILFNHECVTAETPMVFRKNGILDIQEIQDLVPHRENPSHGKKHQSVPKDLELWDGRGWTKATLATATWSGGEKKVYEISARGGVYRATGDHISFLEGQKEVKTNALLPGNRLQLYPLPKAKGLTELSEQEAYFLGLMAGDGYVCVHGGSARFTHKDTSLLQYAGELFRQLTGGNYRIDHSKCPGFTGEVIPSAEFSNARGFFDLWRSELYDERGKKKVPVRVLNASTGLRESFLTGYNKADGLRAGPKLNREFKSFKTNSSCLAQGLCFLAESLGYRVSVYIDRGTYYTLNVGLISPETGAHLQKPLEEVRSVKQIPYTGWLFDLATESETFSAGVGRTWIHNSPRRGETFVTRKITKAVANIARGTQTKLFLGNLDAQRDWGFAGDYVEGMWKMLQQDKPDDYILATGHTHSVKEFLEIAFRCVDLDYQKFVEIDPKYFRPAEVDLLLGDPAKAKRQLGWESKTSFPELVRMMVRADYDSFS